MIALLSFFLTLLVSPFKSRSRLEAENAALRHQLIVLQRRLRGRVQLTNGDRLFLVQLYRWFPSAFFKSFLPERKSLAFTRRLHPRKERRTHIEEPKIKTTTGTIGRRHRRSAGEHCSSRGGKHVG